MAIGPNARLNEASVDAGPQRGHHAHMTVRASLPFSASLVCSGFAAKRPRSQDHAWVRVNTANPSRRIGLPTRR